MTDQPLTGDEEALALYKAAWAEASPKHEERCKRYDEQEDAYHAELKPTDDVGYHNLAPHYAYEVIELLASNLVDDHPRPKVRPLSQEAVGMPGQMGAADLLEKVILQHRASDARDEKLPVWVKRGLVHNLSPAKMSWDYEERTTKRRVFNVDPFAAGGYTESEPVEEKQIACDRPTLTLMDPRDFLFAPDAKTIDETPYILARFYETKQSLRKQAKKGEYGIYKNLDQIKTGEGSGKDARKNRVTIVEYWTRERLIVVANHQVVIRDEENPYWHGDLPFVAMVLVPDLRKMEGISVVETVQPLQDALWRSLNQRLDMAELVLNPPIIQSAQTGDQIPDFKPGARFFNEFGPDAFHFANTPVGLLAAAIENAATIRGDMRDISGAVPALSGAASDTVDQKTATGISIIQSVAQQRLKRMRSQAGIAEKRCGRLELAMIQQLTRRVDAIRIDAKEGATFQPYTPQQLQPPVEFDIDDVNESLDQQRRRDEANVKVQTMLAINAQAPGLINLETVAEDFLEAFDEEDAERFLHKQQPDASQMAGPAGIPPGAPPPFGPPPGGVAPPMNGGGAPPMQFAPHPALAPPPGMAA